MTTATLDVRARAQEGINILEGTPGLAEQLLRDYADRTHAAYPQFAGYWDEWGAGRMTRQLRTKGGVIEEGDIVLFRIVDLRPASPDVTVFSARRGCNVSIPRGWGYVEAL